MYQAIGLTPRQLIYYLGVAIVLTAAGFVIHRQLGARQTRRRTFQNGFAGLGAFVGLVLGLSATPIVNAFVASAFTLAGVLLPMFDKNPPTGAAKTARVRWMAPFGFAAVLGVFVGLVIRANDLLAAPETPLRERIIAQGYSGEQADAILARWAEKATPIQLVAQAEWKPKGPLLSSSNPSGGDPKPAPVGEPIPDEIRSALVEGRPLRPDQRLALLRSDPALRARIDNLRDAGRTVEEILELLKPK